MEYLEYERFRDEQELCDWVNINRVRVVAITEDLRVWTLFYKKILD